MRGHTHPQPPLTTFHYWRYQVALTLTIYQALTLKLGRTPTSAEVKADVQRIIHEGTQAAKR